MRLPRLGCLGWMVLGIPILSVYITYAVVKGLFVIVGGIFKAASNRQARAKSRRATRKAYERDLALRQRIASQQAHITTQGMRWYDERGYPRNAWTGEPMDEPPPRHPSGWR